MLQETSLEAYRNLPMGEIQRKVLAALMGHVDLTNQEIGRIIGKDASTVSGVVKPMRERAMLEYSRKRMCGITGNHAIAWRIRPLKPLPPAFDPKPEKPKNLFE